MGGNEHQSSVGVSGRTETGTASISGRASAKVLLFETSRSRTGKPLAWQLDRAR
jgi:hypothetical protein